MFARRSIPCAAVLSASCARRSAAVAAEAEESPRDPIPADPLACVQYFKARRQAVERLTEACTLLGTNRPAASSAVTAANDSSVNSFVAGLYQVNVHIPNDAIPGSQVPFELSFTGVAGRPSNIATIAIQ